MAGDGSLGHRLHGPETGTRIVLGDHHDERRHCEADQAAEEERLGSDGQARTSGDRSRDQGVHNPPDRADGQHAGDDQALVEGAHDILRAAKPDTEGADD